MSTPFTVAWDNTEQAILCYRFQGEWTWDEYAQAGQMLDTVEHIVDYIDFLEDTEFPLPAMSRLKGASDVPAFTHTDAGRMAIIGTTRLMPVIIDAFNRNYARPGKKVVGVNTEAYEQIARFKAECDA